MQYTVKQLAELSGVSARTLRWYDHMGLLCPARGKENGYRFYTAQQVDLLQQILFYRALGLELSAIRQLMQDASFDRLEALKKQREALSAQLAHTGRLIDTIDRTIRSCEEGIPMKDTEKFESFKQKRMEENETAHGAEARAKWGDEAMNASNKKLLGQTQAEYSDMQQTEAGLLAQLSEAVQTKADPAGEAGRAVAALHKKWLCFTWPTYTAAAHRGVAEMYLADERFTGYYDDRAGAGAAQFLHDAIVACIR